MTETCKAEHGRFRKSFVYFFTFFLKCPMGRNNDNYLTLLKCVKLICLDSNTMTKRRGFLKPEISGLKKKYIFGKPRGYFHHCTVLEATSAIKHYACVFSLQKS